MSKTNLHLIDLTFRYETAAEPLFDTLSLTIPQGWTGVVGANGIGKTTLLKLAANQLHPITGSVSSPGAALYLEQRTDIPPDYLAEFLTSYDAEAYRIRERLQIGDDYAQRWDTLSHGERKRAQIAGALWREPEVLAVDEPTNHLDLEARNLVGEALARYGGVGLIVSHDRHLLDRLCSRCLFLGSSGPRMRPGGVSEGLEEEERELAYQREQYRNTKAEVARLKKEADRRGRAAAAADRKRSKRSIDRKDRAAKTDIDLARVTGKDAVAGKLLRQLDGRIEHAQAKLTDSKAPAPKRKLGITLAGETARSDTICRLPEGRLALGGRSLYHPALRIEPTDRIGLVGPNGGGKSTLIREMVSLVEGEDIVYLPQELDRQASTNLLERVRALANDELGVLLSAVSRLGSDPEAVLQTELPSPGETRKLMIAEGLAGAPKLIVLDEPTNHMDLPSIRCLEEALRETVCALLLVSHDAEFLSHLTSGTWKITPAEEDYELMVC